ncbi:MAG TPA: baseplate J/gp47 family protein [Rhodocyclaceae bacterium]|nr:baseplate J/gp47 family protein [Rhodocyclaceae bacterium]
MARDANGVSTLSPNPPTPAPTAYASEANEARIFSLLLSGSGIGRWLGQRFKMRRPIYLRSHIPAPSPRSGFITVSLEEDFLHADYRKESVQHAVNQDKIVLAEPWTPAVQSISLSYSAISDPVDMSADDENTFASLDLQLFHIGCFGQRREHAFIRQRLDFVGDKQLRLLPHYPNQGELLIGLSGGVNGYKAGDGVSLLMQAAEGSADPELAAQKLEWAVLCDNHWRTLTPQELVLDTSNDLRTTGIVALTLPHESDTDNTWLPAGRIWLRAAIAQDSGAACQLVAVAANAVEVAFVDQGNDPQHLATTLAAGSIAKLKTPQAEIKKLSQPYAGFGGAPTETDGHLTRRAAERLRHRNRCITPWDYERMLLEAFPGVHRVKCIPHASETSWLAPGHVMLIAIPDLRNQNAVDKLRPRVDLNTLTLMSDYAQAHCGMQVKLKVRNPSYQRVRADFKVRFMPGKPFNFYRNELEQALIRALSPWAFDATREITFSGRLYRSVLLDFVEELPYVDFVSDFRLGIVDDADVLHDAADIAAATPDAILVSDAAHTINEIP